MRWYNTFHAQQNHQVIQTIVGRPVRPNIGALNKRSVVVWDLYEIEAGIDAALVNRVQRHMQTHPNCAVVINLSHENLSPVSHGLTVFDDFIKLWNPHQVVVWASQADTLETIAHHNSGIRTQQINFWEYATAYHAPTPLPKLASTHRISSLNRRYSQQRAQVIYSMRHYTNEFNYTFGAGDPWGDTGDLIYQEQEWRNHSDIHLRDSILKWQAAERPWRSLNNDITCWEYDHTWQFTAAADICLIVESRHSQPPKRKCAFVTEKTFRPIALGKPIIVCGQRSIIHTLNSWGYQTINKRSDVNSVIELAQHICTMSNSEYQTQLTQWQKSAQANQQLLQTRTAPKPLAEPR
jgi:hypothetical protein